MNTADRVLAVLSLFSMSQPEWTVESAAGALNIPVSTTYRYFRSLVEAGLIINFSAGRYVLGPAIIELDRQTRQYDPLIRSSEATMQALTAGLSFGAVSLLCRIYRLTVMCVDQVRNADQAFAVSYERGRPMPLIKGAASLSITAYLSARTLKRYFDTQTDLSVTWEEFRNRLRKIRAAGVAYTQGELDTGLLGISAPIFAPDGDILASIGVVVEAKNVPETMQAELRERVRLAGIEVSTRLKSDTRA